MYWKYSTGFLIASLIQAVLILTFESLNISNLGAKLTLMQLIIHILAGQVAGFLLLWIMRTVKQIGEANLWVTGIIFGFLVWTILLTINSMQGVVNAPWREGLLTVVSTLFAFIVFGIVSTYTIKEYGKEILRKGCIG